MPNTPQRATKFATRTLPRSSRDGSAETRRSWVGERAVRKLVDIARENAR